MRAEGPQNDQPSRTEMRRRRRRAGRRRLAIAVSLLVLLIIAIGLAIGLSRGGTETTSSTSSSLGAGSTTTDSATTTSVASGSTTSSAPTGGSESSTTTASVEPSGAQTFLASLDGEQEVPPVTTSATGTLTLTVSADLTSVDYILKVSKLSNLTVARLHEGASGKEGSTIATLYDGPTKSGSFTGTLAQGTLTKADLAGPLAGKTIEDLVVLLAAGSVYINVGSTSHTSGEIRGQLEASVPSSP
jgi:hypothetical protein